MNHTTLDVLKPDAVVTGLIEGETVTIRSAEPAGDYVTLMYKTQAGNWREDVFSLAELQHVQVAQPSIWTFDADANKYYQLIESILLDQLAFEEQFLALNQSRIEPLPHQLIAVYSTLLKQHPIRYLLADDPGAGKTITAGLLIKELQLRLDVKHCLIVAPGGLCQQWQDELAEKLALESTHYDHSQPEQRTPITIARMDKLARQLKHTPDMFLGVHYDLIIVDEAHRCSAHQYGAKIDKTSRYRLVEQLGEHTRHLLLMTATPHNGKDESFFHFLALIDADRFCGLFNRRLDASAQIDTRGIMRRLAKESLCAPDGTPLFPPREARTIAYQIDGEEQRLYEQVTTYVRDEMDKVRSIADDQIKRNMTFAMQVLQRRLSSSPAAICASLKTRRDKIQRCIENPDAFLDRYGQLLYGDAYADTNDDDFSSSEHEESEELALEFLAKTPSFQQALKEECAILDALIVDAENLKTGGTDVKWRHLRKYIEEIRTTDPAESDQSYKLIIFSEARDTLHYLQHKIITDTEYNAPNVAIINGSVSGQARQEIITRFRRPHDPTRHDNLSILIANDAVSEGVNLEVANTVINYDLPWNPNRLEQRFGRVHRIKQKRTCRLWNLLAENTREGEVYKLLLEKITTVTDALNGEVFDVLGLLFKDVSLREVIWQHTQNEKITIDKKEYAPKAALKNLLDASADIPKKDQLYSSHDDRLLKLSKEVMGQFTRAKQFRYQPIFLKNYIVRAMDAFGGSINLERTRDDTEIWRLKLPNQLLASAQPTLPTSVNNAQWTFDPPKYEINIPLPTMLTPQHQVVKAIANYTKDQFRNDQLRGAAFIANADEFAELTVDLIYTYSIKQRAQDKDTHADSGYALAQQCIAVRMRMHNGEFLPSEVIDRPVMHRDLQPAKDIPPELIPPIDSKLIAGARQKVLSHQTALRDEIKQQIDMSSLARYEASKEQLTNEKQRQQDIIDSKKQPQKNRDNAQKRVIELEQRLNAVIQRRRQEQEVTSQAPQLVAGYVIIPQHMLPNTTTIDLAARRAIERKAISIITEEEQAEGRKIIDVSSGNHGYDLLSTREGTPDRKLEVKGRFRTQPDPQVSLTGNEFACMRNSGDEITLCAVIFDNDTPYPEVIRIPGSRFESSDPRLFDHYSLAVSSLRELSQTTSNPK